MQWAEEIKPSLLVLARHGGHRIEGTELGSQAENLVRLAPCNVLLIGTVGVRPEDIPWIEEDGQARSIVGARRRGAHPPRARRSRRASPQAPVEEFVLEQTDGAGDDRHQPKRLDEAIKKLLPTHMQLIMGIGTAEELALAEIKADEQMKRTKVQGHDDDPVPAEAMIEVKCPFTGHVSTRPRVATDPIVWTEEAWRPPAARSRSSPGRSPATRSSGSRATTTSGASPRMVMDENKQAMIEADEFDMDTMMVMFTRAAGQADPRRGRRAGTALVARDAAVHRGGEGAGHDALPDPRHRGEGRPVPGRLQDHDAGGGARPAVESGSMAAQDGRRCDGGKPHLSVSDGHRWSGSPRTRCEASRRTGRDDHVPHVVAWNLTRRCNLECAHCYISAGPDGTRRRRADHRRLSADRRRDPRGQPVADVHPVRRRAAAARRPRARSRRTPRSAARRSWSAPTAPCSPTSGSPRSRTPG